MEHLNESAVEQATAIYVMVVYGDKRADKGKFGNISPETRPEVIHVGGKTVLTEVYSQEIDYPVPKMYHSILKNISVLNIKIFYSYLYTFLNIIYSRRVS